MNPKNTNVFYLRYIDNLSKEMSRFVYKDNHTIYVDSYELDGNTYIVSIYDTIGSLSNVVYHKFKIPKNNVITIEKIA